LLEIARFLTQQGKEQPFGGTLGDLMPFLHRSTAEAPSLLLDNGDRDTSVGNSSRLGSTHRVKLAE